MTNLGFSEEQRDCLQEIINVAMGLASDKLARFLNTFVHLRVPSIALVGASLIPAEFESRYRDTEAALVSQGFFGNEGVRGEAIVLYQMENAHKISALLGYDVGDVSEIEMLTDISSILTTTFLNGLAQQLENSLSYSAPRVLSSTNGDLSGMLKNTSFHWEHALKVDISYQLVDHSFNCDMILLIPGEAVSNIKTILDRILEAY
ncbi:chemotaxis protein [Rheinheimera sp.]|uniref:chemotaxis protein n=1 Tax=Rheinheimera sp. TaxID=1869214 RepID=UPI0027BA9D93|nr:chemotaxis protein [Rheinheimera sp.]